MNGPEAKAAEEIEQRRPEIDEQEIRQIILAANHEHYAGLLRKVQKDLPITTHHGSDCLCASCLIRAELARLERQGRGEG